MQVAKPKFAPVEPQHQLGQGHLAGHLVDDDDLLAGVAVEPLAAARLDVECFVGLLRYLECAARLAAAGLAPEAYYSWGNASVPLGRSHLG